MKQRSLISFIALVSVAGPGQAQQANAIDLQRRIEQRTLDIFSRLSAQHLDTGDCDYTRIASRARDLRRAAEDADSEPTPEARDAVVDAYSAIPRCARGRSDLGMIGFVAAMRRATHEVLAEALP
jgi:hypothetical protein